MQRLKMFEQAHKSERQKRIVKRKNSLVLGEEELFVDRKGVDISTTPTETLSNMFD